MYAPSTASVRPDQKSPLRANGFIGSGLVASERDDFRDRAARRAKFHRDHPRLAHQLAAARLDLLGRLAQVLDLDREMVDAWAFARGLRFGGASPLVVLHQGE